MAKNTCCLTDISNRVLSQFFRIQTYFRLANKRIEWLDFPCSPILAHGSEAVPMRSNAAFFIVFIGY